MTPTVNGVFQEKPTPTWPEDRFIAVYDHKHMKFAVNVKAARTVDWELIGYAESHLEAESMFEAWQLRRARQEQNNVRQ